MEKAELGTIPAVMGTSEPCLPTPPPPRCASREGKEAEETADNGSCIVEAVGARPNVELDEEEDAARADAAVTVATRALSSASACEYDVSKCLCIDASAVTMASASR